MIRFLEQKKRTELGKRLTINSLWTLPYHTKHKHKFFAFAGCKQALRYQVKSVRKVTKWATGFSEKEAVEKTCYMNCAAEAVFFGKKTKSIFTKLPTQKYLYIRARPPHFSLFLKQIIWKIADNFLKWNNWVLLDWIFNLLIFQLIFFFECDVFKLVCWINYGFLQSNLLIHWMIWRSNYKAKNFCELYRFSLKNILGKTMDPFKVTLLFAFAPKINAPLNRYENEDFF